MRLFLAIAIAALAASCAGAQKPATQARTGSCLIQGTEALTRVTSETRGFTLELPYDGWKVECAQPPRVLFAYSRSLGLHVTGEILQPDGKPSAEKLLRAFYAIAREKARRAGTRVGEADFEIVGGQAVLRYEVLLDNPNVLDEQRTNIRSVHELKPLEMGDGKLMLLHVSWAGSNRAYEELRSDISMPIRTFAAAQ